MGYPDEREVVGESEATPIVDGTVRPLLAAAWAAATLSHTLAILPSYSKRRVARTPHASGTLWVHHLTLKKEAT